MCGINGITLANAIDRVRKMNTYTARRGPEGSEVWSGYDVTLGHNMLATMSCPEVSGQPMHYKDTTIVFNGSIFNWKELDEWDCKVDTEVLIRGLYYYGIGFLDNCDGMWVFAWRNKGALTLCRDRFGIKSLFYRQIKEGLIFSSSPHALEINNYKLDLFAFSLLRDFGYVPGYLTIIKGILKLVPGEVITYDLCNQNIYKQSIWQKSFDKTNWSKHDFLERLENAIKLSGETSRQRGVLLSGGLDSSCIMHFLEEEKTFTTRFEPVHNQIYNEDADYAKELSKEYDLSHKECVISQRNFIANTKNTVRAIDLPSLYKNHSAYCLIHKLMREEDIIITYSGDGGDEMFGGYMLHEKYRNKLDKCPFSLHYEAASCQGIDRINLLQCSFEQSNKSAYIEYMRSWFPTQIFGNDLINNCFSIEMLTRVSDEFLFRNDRFGAYYGMEGRFPFLNNDFYYYVMGINSNLKMKNENPIDHKPGQYKYILRESLRGLLPDFIVNKRKTGWTAPIWHWSKARVNTCEIDEEIEKLIDWKNIARKYQFPVLELREWLGMYEVTL